MVTTVDALVVTLGLDPSNFNEGQRKALDSLRRFEEQAKNSVKRSQETSQFNVRFFFAALQHPMQAAQQALMEFATKSQAASNKIQDASKSSQQGMKNVADQSKRTGDAVEEGAATGAAAVRGLAAAALLAFGAFKGLQNVMGAIQKEVNFSTMTGFMAQWTGVSPEWMSKFSAAAFKKTGAPQEQTQSWMLQMQSAIQAFVTPGSMQQGVATPMIQALMRMGINPFPLVGQNSQQAMETLMPQIEEKLSSAKPEQRAMFAQQLGMPLLLMQFMSMGSAAVKAATEAEKVVDVTKKETKAAQDLAEAERQVALDTDKLSRLMMTNLAPALVAVLNAVSGFLEFIPKLGDAIDSMMNKLPPWAQKLIEWSGPLGWALGGLRQYRHTDEEGGTDEGTGQGSGNFGSARPGPGGDMPLDLRSPPPGIGTDSFAGPTDQEWATMSKIASRESGGGTMTGHNLWNYKHDQNPNYWTAGGYWQMIRGNWKAYAPKVGIDLNQYPEAINAPPALQARVALYMLRQFGTQPWSQAAGGSMPNVANNNTPPPVANQAQSLINNRASSSTINSGGNTMHNNINISLPPGSSNYQVGQAAANEVQRQIAVSSANYGYE